MASSPNLPTADPAAKLVAGVAAKRAADDRLQAEAAKIAAERGVQPPAPRTGDGG